MISIAYRPLSVRAAVVPAIAMCIVSAIPLGVHAEWTYAAGAGTANGKPYSGIISDGNWGLRVYRPDDSSDDFWLGCGGAGTQGCVAGSGTLDLSTLLADTTAAGTPVRIVNVAAYAVNRKGSALTGLVLPDTVTNIANVAFEQCNLASLDLRNTRIRSIRGYAFAWCQSLSEVWLPETLEYVGKCALRTMPNNTTIHFAGDVPYLEPPSSNSYGSGFSVYTSATEYQNIFAGGQNQRWAFCVNAEKYPNWTRIGKATYYDEENPFPSGEAGWVPASARAVSGYAAPFGNTWFSRTSDTSSGGRSYLVQEGTGDGTTIARPMFGSVETTAKRTAVTNAIAIYVGSSPSVSIAYTFGDETQTLTLTEDRVLVFVHENLADSTTFSWSISAEGASGTDFVSGTATTLTPDVVLGEPYYEITKDGKTATLYIPVTALLSESATLAVRLGDETVHSFAVTETGIFSYVADDLTLGRTYDFSFAAFAGTDEDVKALSFLAERYRWTYTPGEGKQNNMPYSGTISDKTWVLRVYEMDGEKNAFRLGCGGTGGASAVVAAGADLDLTQVLGDTAEDGTPVRLVEIGMSAFKNTGALKSLVLPDTVTNILNVAFENTGLVSADLSPAPVRSIGGCAFAWCQSLKDVRLPQELHLVGRSAFCTIGDKCVFHFAGPPPELIDNSGDVNGTGYSAYLNKEAGKYSNFYRGSSGAQLAFAVDNRLYPAWNDPPQATTSLYTTENPFPATEASWIPEPVRYTATDAYKAPFASTNFGRTPDTAANGRTYLVYEKHGEAGTVIILY